VVLAGVLFPRRVRVQLLLAEQVSCLRYSCMLMLSIATVTLRAI
jgi:hypothetical protein